MNSSFIVASTPNYESSLNFYRKLGFLDMEIEDGRILISKDIKIILLSSPKARSGFRFYKENWSKEVQELSRLTSVYSEGERHFLNDASGVRIELVNGIFDQNDSVQANNDLVPGNFAGISLEGISIAQMSQIYKILGFRVTMGKDTDHWMSLSNSDGFGISLMKIGVCPHQFYNPSLTFFNSGKNLEVIRRIKDLNIPVTEEITVFNEKQEVDNVILRDPGGIGFFVFND